MTKILLSLSILFTITCVSQNTAADKIQNVLATYFSPERENIHVHFDKNIYSTDEKIWFSGYIYNSKTEMPFVATTNIFVNLINQEGQIIYNTLVYASGGTFTGDITLNENMVSGCYYLQFYTNWMNNFNEDGSFIQEIKIFNPDRSPEQIFTQIPEGMAVNINPEGGNYILGVSNTFGINVKYPDNRPLKNTEVEIINNKGQTILFVKLNPKGYGKFVINAETESGLRAVIKLPGRTIVSPFPEPLREGIAFTVNDIISTNDKILTLRTPEATRRKLAGQKLLVLFHKNDMARLYEIKIGNANEYKLNIANDSLFSGITTIRVLNESLIELAQRLVYKSVFTNVSSTKKTDGIKHEGMAIKGYTNPGMKLSIAVLPENTLSLTPANDMYTSLLVQPYIKDMLFEPGKYYFENPTRITQYELDLMLLNSRSKHGWLNIKNNPPKIQYSFDIGITVKGTINNILKNSVTSMVRVTAVNKVIDELTMINDKNEFYIKNLVVPDSTRFEFSLVEDGRVTEQLKLYPVIENNKKAYNKPFKPSMNQHLIAFTGRQDSVTAALPKLPLRKGIQLDEVVINKKTKLKYQHNFNNRTLKGYRYENGDIRGNTSLITYLKQNGFIIQYTPQGDLIVISRDNGYLSYPWLEINNVVPGAGNYEVLKHLLLKDVEEIYISRTYSKTTQSVGIIKLYLKDDYKSPKADAYANFTLNKGFSKINPFKNAEYIETNGKGFENFGLIHWEPAITANDKGEFNFKIPNTGQKSIKLLIEGFSVDGKLLSEIKTLHVD